MVALRIAEGDSAVPRQLRVVAGVGVEEWRLGCVEGWEWRWEPDRTGMRKGLHSHFGFVDGLLCIGLC